MRLAFKFTADAIVAGTVALGLTGNAAVASEAATGDKRLEADFEVYWLGFRVYSGNLQGTLADGRYRMAAAGETRGILAVFVSAEVRSEVAGKVDGAAYAPLAYRSKSRWDERRREIDVDYNGDGSVDAVRRPPRSDDDWDADRDEVPPAMRRDTLDPLTTLLKATTRPLDAAPCDVSLPVFDGRRRYNLRLKYAGEEDLPAELAPAYAGGTVKCHAHFDKIAGFAKKWSEENPQPEEPATVWLAKLPAKGVWLPVRAVGASSWGAIEAAVTRHAVETGSSTASATPTEQSSDLSPMP